MKLAAAVFVCASLAQSSAFLVESDGLQSWGEQDTPSEWERADTAASDMAAWMPKSNKRRRVDIEFEHRHIRGHGARKTTAKALHGQKSNVVPVAKWLAEAHPPLPREAPGLPATTLPTRRHQPPADLLPEPEEAPAPTVQPANVLKAVLKPRFAPEHFAHVAEQAPVPEPVSAENTSSSVFERSVQETAAWAAQPSKLAHPALEHLVKTSNEIPLEVANSTEGDEGPEVSHKTRTVVATHELHGALKKLKAEIPLRTMNNAKGDEGPEVGQTIRRVAVANATRHLQKLTKAPSNASEPAVQEPPSNKLVRREEAVSANGTLSAELACVCGGVFKEGELVKYTGHAFPPGRTVGTILGGTTNGFLNVEWHNFSTGHTGNCKLTTCGVCTETHVKSRWFTSCEDLIPEEPAALSTTTPPLPSASAAPLKQPPSNQLVHREETAVSAVNGASSAELACVCGGTFKKGERVKYTGHAFPPGRTFGTILGGTDSGFLNVEWENFSTGHTGNCKHSTCGSCTESIVKSRWFTSCEDLATEETAALSTTAAPMQQLLSNQLVHQDEMSAVNGTSSAELACVCGGIFREGNRVKYTGHAFPAGRHFGTILGGTDNGFLNVEWDNFSTGHTGNCKLTTCGSCPETLVKSRWFTACSDLVMADAKPAILVHSSP